MALTLTRSCTASIDIAAPIDVVWDLVSDITRIGVSSVECRSCEWLAGATDPRPGARVRGRNWRNATLWTRTCEVLAVDPPKRFVWRTLPTRLLPDSTEWTFELADSGDHTRLTQSMRILHIPAPTRAYSRSSCPSTATAPRPGRRPTRHQGTLSSCRPRGKASDPDRGGEFCRSRSLPA